MPDPLAQSPFFYRLTEARPNVTQARLQIADLSTLPRTGLKGKGTTQWLTTKVSVMPEAPNTAATQADGSVIAWLGGQEYLVLSDPEGKASLCDDLNAAWPTDHAASTDTIGYPLPRADSHSWLWLSGADVPTMMGKICSVDLRPANFTLGLVVQTVVARIGAVLVRANRVEEYGLYLLSNVASANYLWDVMQDASAEFGGGFL